MTVSFANLPPPDAILDRLVRTSHRIDLEGEGMRKNSNFGSIIAIPKAKPEGVGQ